MHPLPPPNRGQSSHPPAARDQDQSTMNPFTSDRGATPATPSEARLSTVSTAPADGKKEKKTPRREEAEEPSSIFCRSIRGIGHAEW